MKFKVDFNQIANIGKMVFKRLFNKGNLKIFYPHYIDYCDKCHKNMCDEQSFWAEFKEINSKVYQVKICDECESKNPCIQKSPTQAEAEAALKGDGKG